MGGGADCHSSSATPPGRQYLFKAVASASSTKKKGREIEMLQNNTFFQENPFQERVLVTEHQTFICSTAVTLLKRLECLLVMFNGSLELFDILRSPFAKRGLRLSVSLLSFFRRRIYLQAAKLISKTTSANQPGQHTGFLPPFRFCL